MSDVKFFLRGYGQIIVNFCPDDINLYNYEVYTVRDGKEEILTRTDLSSDACKPATIFLKQDIGSTLRRRGVVCDMVDLRLQHI